MTYLPVDRFGRVYPDDFRRALTPRTILASMMHANNEVGTLQPISEIARIAREHGVLFNTDAAQSAGKIPTAVDELGVDLLSLAGHKLYAPKGIGVSLYSQGCSAGATNSRSRSRIRPPRGDREHPARCWFGCGL